MYAYNIINEQTLFSKDTGTYTVTDNENKLDLLVDEDGALEIWLYNRGTDILTDSDTDDGVITNTTWYHIAYSLEFDGKHTNVCIDVDGTNILTSE